MGNGSDGTATACATATARKSARGNGQGASMGNGGNASDGTATACGNGQGASMGNGTDAATATPNARATACRIAAASGGIARAYAIAPNHGAAWPMVFPMCHGMARDDSPHAAPHKRANGNGGIPAAVMPLQFPALTHSLVKLRHSALGGMRRKSFPPTYHRNCRMPPVQVTMRARRLPRGVKSAFV